MPMPMYNAEDEAGIVGDCGFAETSTVVSVVCVVEMVDVDDCCEAVLNIGVVVVATTAV